jgi:hypothetical protein
MPKTPSEVEQRRVLNWVNEQFQLADEHRRSYQDKWDAWEKLYRGKVDNPTWWSNEDSKWRSKIFVPISFTLVETIVPRLVQGLFAERPFWDMVAKDKSSEPARDAAMEYMEFLVYQMMGFFKQFVRGLKEAPKKGTAFYKVFSRPRINYAWQMKGRIRRTIERVPQMVMLPEMRPVSIYDLWFHPLAKDVNGPDGALFTAEKVRVPKRKFQALKDLPGYFNIKRVQDTSFPVKEEEEDWASYEYRNLTPPQERAREDFVEVFEVYGDYDLRGKGNLVPVRTRVANRSIIISIDEMDNSDKPYWRSRYGLNENDIYGISSIEPITDLQDTVNTFVRQRLDNSTMLNWGMFKRRRGANIEDACVKPGKFIDVNRMEDLEQLVINDHTGGLMNDVAFLSMVIDRVTGVNDYIRGTGEAGKQTAFEVGTLVQESHARFDLALRMIREEGLTQALDLIWNEALRVLPRKFDIRVLGKDAAEFKRQRADNIIGNFDWEIKIPPYQGNRMLMATKLQTALASAAQFPQFVQGAEVLFKHLFEALEVPYPQDFIVDPNKKFEIQSASVEALIENEMAMQDNVPEPDVDENHAVHLQVHTKGDPRIAEVMVDHIALHEIYLEQSQGGAGSQAPGAQEGPERMPEESENIRIDSIRESPGTEGPMNGRREAG